MLLAVLSFALIVPTPAASAGQTMPPAAPSGARPATGGNGSDVGPVDLDGLPAGLGPHGAGNQPSTCDHAPDRVLVRFREQAVGKDHGALYARIDAEHAKKSRLVPGLAIVKTTGRADKALAKLRSDPDVAYAELDCRITADALPNDSLFSQEWGLRNTGQTGGTSGADIHAPAAWDIRTDASSVIVAVIDTGIEWNHPDLSANIWTNTDETAGNGVDDDHNGYVDDRRGWDFVNGDNNPTDDNFHGTHVAGTIGARGNNGIGVTGVAWSVKLMPLKAFDAGGSGYTSAIVGALEYAVDNGARVSNNSYSTDFPSRAMYDAFVAAAAAGMVSAAAAGNDGRNSDETPRYPAAFRLDAVLSVAATDHDDALAGFSNYGIYNVHVAAPGESILSTVPGSAYGFVSGTSMATPHVAGVLALLAAAHPTWTPLQLRNRVLGTTRDVPGLVGKAWTGGVLDAAAALGGGATTLPPAFDPFTTQALSTSVVDEPAPAPAVAPEPPTFPPLDIVESSERRIDPPSIAIDGAGHPAIAYSRFGAGVELATLASGSWNVQVVTQAYSEFSWLDLRFGADGVARIGMERLWSDPLAYWDPGTMLATVDGPDVALERITAACPDADSCFLDWASSVAIDSTGSAHVAFGRTGLAGVPISDRVVPPAGSAPAVPGDGLYYAGQVGGGWEVRKLTSGHEDSLVALALSPANAAHLIFRRGDGSASGLYHATNDTGSWTIRRLTDHSEDLGVGVRVDGAGVVHVAFTRHGRGLYYISRSAGGTWSGTTLVYDGYAFQPDLEIDGAGKAHVTFGLGDEDNTTAGVRYATNKTGPWVVSTIANGQAGNASLAIDGAGKAHVAYMRADTYPLGLYYATNTTGSWVSSLAIAQSVEAEPGWSAYARDAAGYGHVAAAAHFGEANAGLYYGTNRSGTWTYSRVYSGWPSSVALAVDDGGHASIAFAEKYAANGAFLPEASWRVGLATNANGSWSVERVSPGADFDHNGVALALDAQQQPHVAYVSDFGAKKLLYARRGPSGWTISTALTATGYIEHPSLVVDPTGMVHMAVDVQESGETGTRIAYVRGGPGSWTSSSGTSASTFNQWPSIGWTTDGSIWIAATRIDDGVWVHRRTAGGSWSSTQLASHPADAFPSLRVDAQDRVLVAFSRRAFPQELGCTVPACEEGPGLRLAIRDGGPWSTTKLTPIPYDWAALVAAGGDGSVGVATVRAGLGFRVVEAEAGAFAAGVMLRPASDTGESATDGITNAAALTFDVTFDRPVTGFVAGDLGVSGTATGCSAGAPSGSGRLWSVVLTGCSAGTVGVAVVADSVSDGDASGPVANASSRLVVIDRAAPSAAAPTLTLRSAVSLSSASTSAGLPVALAWTATDAGGAGIGSFDVARSDNGAAFATIAGATAATTLNATVTPGHTYVYRARAWDKAGNLSAYVAGPSLKPSLYQGGNSTIKYTGTWKTGTSTSYSNGTVKFSKSAGASASYTFTGRAIAFVTTKRSTAGKVKVYIDGVLTTTIDTVSASTTFRFVAYAKTWTTSGTHTIKLVVSGTSGRPRVDLDALEVVR